MSPKHSMNSSMVEAEPRMWADTEGSPLPLGVTWIEEEQAFNFTIHAEHAENVTLLLCRGPIAAKERPGLQ